MKCARKNALSILLPLVLLVGLLSDAARAENRSATVSTWQSLQSALDSGGSIQLGADLSGDTTLTVGAAVTLDLNGHTLTRVSDRSGGSGSVIRVEDGGALTLTDRTVTDANRANDVTHYYYLDEAGLAHVTTSSAAAQAEARNIRGGNSLGSQAVWTAAGHVGSFIGGYITGGMQDGSGSFSVGGGVHINGGSFIMEAGTIIGNATHDGAGVYNGGTFIMSGSAAIIGNAGTACGGVSNHGLFTMKSGDILYNTATAAGSSGGVYNAVTFVMEDGTISHNEASYGGVLHYYGTFTMTGGTVTKNRGADVGGVLAMGGEFRVSGSPVVEGNDGAIAKNACVLVVPDEVPSSLMNDRTNEETLREYLASIREIVKPIIVEGRLDAKARIGVTLAPFLDVALTMYGNDYLQEPDLITGVFTSGYADSGNTDAPSSCFFSDADSCAVVLSGGEAALSAQAASNPSSNTPNSVSPFVSNDISSVSDSMADCPRDGSCPISAYWFDSSPTAWYHDGVHYALENGIMSGYSAHGFAPGDAASRAMVTTMLWRLEGSPIVSGDTGYADVPDSMWYSDAVRWASGAGIITGSKIPADTVPWPMGFRPDDAVTREQLSVMLYRYAQYKGADVSAGENTNISSYDDAFDVMEYAIPAMRWACGAGIVSGMTNGTRAVLLAPQSNASRAVVATMFMRYCAESAK